MLTVASGLSGMSVALLGAWPDAWQDGKGVD